MWEEQVRCIVGKELDDICTSCPYIDAVKRHKQQLGAIEEYTKWLKKEPRASYFFLFRLYTRIHNTFFPQKQQLPFTPGGTHCPEPDKRKRPETQDSHPFLKNVQECPRNICGLPWVFHRNRRLPVPEKSRCAPCIRIISTVKLYGSAPVTC